MTKTFLSFSEMQVRVRAYRTASPMSFLSGDWWKRDGLRIVRPCRERFDWSGRGVELELLSGGRITSFIVKSPNVKCYLIFDRTRIKKKPFRFLPGFDGSCFSSPILIIVPRGNCITVSLSIEGLRLVLESLDLFSEEMSSLDNCSSSSERWNKGNSDSFLGFWFWNHLI